MSDILPDSRKLTGAHVLAVFCGFFAVVFAVNGYLVTEALSTYSGVVSNEPYRKGLKYNERIEASERQTKLGWTGDMAFSPDGQHLLATLRDGAGQPVRGLVLTGVLGRPATSRDDAALTFEETAPGQYISNTALSSDGAFIANLQASDPRRSEDGVVYRARKRLWLKH